MKAWDIVDHGTISALLADGWLVDRLKTPRVEEQTVMVWKAFRWPWLILAPDTARLFDIARELAGSKGGEGKFKRYRVERFSPTTFSWRPGPASSGPMPR